MTDPTDSELATPHSENLEKAKALASDFIAASQNLSLLSSSTLFHEKDFSDWDGTLNRDPAAVKADVTAQISFLRKLKFQYIEQQAKDKYIKTIVDDDAPLITPDDNDALRASNEAKKAKLKIAKDRLAERQEAIRQLAPLVEQDYKKAQSLTSEASALIQKTLDARLALTRLRQAHPAPRLTVPDATAKLDSQIAQMQVLDGQLAAVSEDVAKVKDRVKEGAREVERLKAERAEIEKELEVRSAEAGEEDTRVVRLYDWFMSTLDLHRAYFGLHSFNSPTENTIAVTYLVDMPSPNSEPGKRKTKSREITLTLLFLPNTRRLAEARVTERNPPTSQGETMVAEVELDMGDIIGSHVQANDVPGLVAAVQARVRTGRV